LHQTSSLVLFQSWVLALIIEELELSPIAGGRPAIVSTRCRTLSGEEIQHVLLEALGTSLAASLALLGNLPFVGSDWSFLFAHLGDCTVDLRFKDIRFKGMRSEDSRSEDFVHL
jgi:hypothetical protein